ncbi:MAG: HIT domain-containing protein [Nanoarchaeota archaeon]
MPEGQLTEEDLRNMSPEEIAELQRKNCLFCKIVRGDIPAKKVYEDDEMLAILDINPASKGHTLVLPKEHYPLLPLLPFSLFNHLFTQTRNLIAALEKATVNPGVTLFIANGAAAGQQSPHFLFHLVPRENPTDLPIFNLPTQGWPEQEKTVPILQKQLLLLLRPYLSKTGRLKPTPTYTPPKPPQTSAASPSLFPTTSSSPTSSSLAQAPPPQLFLQPISLSEPIIQEIEASTQQKDPFDPTRLPELLETNQELRRMIISQPDQLLQFIKNSPDLARLFQGIHVHRLSQKLSEYEQHNSKKTENHPPAKPAPSANKADLDKIGELFP